MVSMVWQTLLKYFLKKGLKSIEPAVPRCLKNSAMWVVEKVKASLPMNLFGESENQEPEPPMAREEISPAAAEVIVLLNEIHIQQQIDRYTFIRELAANSRECSKSLADVVANFRDDYMEFVERQAEHKSIMKAIISQFEEKEQDIFTRFEQQRMEVDKATVDRILQVEESLRANLLTTVAAAAEDENHEMMDLPELEDA